MTMSSSTTTRTQKQKSLLSQLLQQKDTLETNIQDHLDILNSASCASVGLQKPLVDAQNFPLQGIDHYNIRKMRGEVRTWQNDLKALMGRIENEIHELHRIAREENEVQGGKSESAGSSNQNDRPQKGVSRGTEADAKLKPFLYVGEIHDNSPAASSGLKVGDLITKFGPVAKEQVDQYGLASVARAVEKSLNEEMRVHVRRGDDDLRLTFTPRVWEGRGYLGCKITLM